MKYILNKTKKQTYQKNQNHRQIAVLIIHFFTAETLLTYNKSFHNLYDIDYISHQLQK